MSADSQELVVSNLRFSYRGPEVIRGVSLQVGSSLFVGIAGPNGAGKSTLLNLLTGYLTPNAGEITVHGKALQSMSRRAVAAAIAYVPQKSDVRFSFSVMEIVLMGRQPYVGLAAFDTAEDVEIAREAMETVGISHLADKAYDQLSGGEQQLTMIARAVAQRAPILLLDEPTSFLDLRHQWDVLKLLKQLTERGTTVVATLHDLNVGARWCDSLVLMKAGQVTRVGAPAEVLTADVLAELYDLPVIVEQLDGAPLVMLPKPVGN